MAFTQISTDGIKNGTITGSDLATNVDLVDNQKIRFGTGNDLEIYHDGTSSFIADTGSGVLKLLTDGLRVRNGADNEHIIKGDQNGAVELYYDGSKKFETTNTGVKVSGTNLNMNSTYIDFSGSISTPSTAAAIYRPADNTLAFSTANTERLKINSSGNVQIPNDSGKLQLGTSQDLEIYHDGATSYIKDTGTGNLRLATSKGEFRNAADTETLAAFIENGGVELYYNNSKKLEVFTWGVEINGDLGLDDNRKLALGNGPDFLFYHDGTSNIITSVNGNLFVQAASGENGITVLQNGGVELYYDNSKKLETTSNGIQMLGHIDLDDQNKLLIGDGNDLQIYHDGTNSFITNATNDLTINSTGDDLILKAADDAVIQVQGSENAVLCNGNGAVELYYDNSKKFETNSLGVGIGTSDTIIYNHSLSESYEGGVVLDGAGSIQVARHNDQCLLLNRMGPDGTIQTFYNDGTCVGFISVSGSTTSYSTNCSDRTLKKNFEDWTENTLSYFKNIKPQKFNFITEEDTVDKTKGYIAQDLVDNFPEAYPKNDEGKYVFNPSGMVVYLMKAIQELEAEVAALKAA